MTARQSPGDTDLRLIHKEDLFEAISMEDVFNTEFTERRAEDRGCFM